ncbi:hypothetical protein FRC02_004646 [Tulasnella sp. 418]|nr:hypothetical protein FRC02_004646 [Tulasnella sp. 418]
MAIEAIFNRLHSLSSSSEAVAPNPTTSGSPSGTAGAVPDANPSLFSFLFSFTAFHDWIKLALIGGVLEFARRSASSLWATFLASFFITVHFEGDDDAYDWMMIWLSRQPRWRKARELQVSTRNWGASSRYIGDENGVVILKEDDCTENGAVGDSRRLNFLPAFGITHTVFYGGTFMRVTRDRKYIGEGSTVESLTVNIFGRKHSRLHNLLVEAQRLHKAEEANRVSIYIADPYNNWRWSGSRPKRPLSSIVLNPGIKETLLDDARDFLNSEAWYAERGIPFRRGYLLHGAPGSGKTSLIHAIAGALELDIYVVSLSKRGLDDATLNELICSLPARSIALMEDIDAAFTHGINREGLPGSSDSDDDKPGPAGSSTSDIGRGVTLSGLLGAIDGVAAQEGRILFATTNNYKVLDPALIRPGRLDLHIEFELASQWQAGEIFKCFYPAGAPESEDVLIEKGPAECDVDSYRDSAESDTASTEVKAPLLNGINKTPQSTATSSPSLASTSDLSPTDDSTSLLDLRRKRRAAPKLTPSQLSSLANRFSSMIPERELSMAAIQGHLMSYKTRPFEAVEMAQDFVEREREKRAARESKRRDKDMKNDSPKRDSDSLEVVEPADSLVV